MELSGNKIDRRNNMCYYLKNHETDENVIKKEEFISDLQEDLIYRGYYDDITF